MAKVYHGDSLNTIDVPYVTEHWVKIQTVIDLENDWTQIYYDDELITEYSWTGGVLGEGGGALDIAAVDLFANGSTSVYYDDLRMEALEIPPVTKTEFKRGDANGDGQYNIADSVHTLRWKFSGGVAPSCFDAAPRPPFVYLYFVLSLAKMAQMFYITGKQWPSTLP